MHTKVAEQVEAGPAEEEHPKRSAQPLILVAALAVVLASLAYGLTAKGPGPLTEGPAPDFTLDLFGGGQLSMSELQGQVVVVNFWASWCAPCRAEAPMLEAAWRTYHEQGVTIVGVDYKDTEPPALAFIEEFSITYPNGPDPGNRIAGAFGVQGVPETFIVSRQGEIEEVFIGSPTEEQLNDTLERLLAASGEE